MKNSLFLLPADGWCGVCKRLKLGVSYIARLFALLISIGLVACVGSAQTRFYTLSFQSLPSDCVTVQKTEHIDKNLSPPFVDIQLAPIEIPTQVARPQIVLVRAPGEVILKENVRWAAPLQDEIHLALQQALSGNEKIAVCVDAQARAPNRQAFMPNQKNTISNPHAYRLTIEIQRFSSALSESGDIPGYASMRAVWRLTWVEKSKHKVLFLSSERHRIKGMSDFTETFTQPGYTALVLAHQHLIEHLASDILKAIPAIKKGDS